MTLKKEQYDMVIGLETHVELRTNSKVFCTCANTFGSEPNTNVCPVCMGLPGALPVFNEKVLEYAALAGMALHCHVHHISRFDRKNYFYPDLPKAYQISQFYRPICENGFITIQTSQGEKRIGITRIHIEEDAGKLTHDEKQGTLVDMNRCGVPLIEIVSEPDIASAEEAVAYLRKLRAILTYTGVSDCKMNEGSLRCDVNLSIRKPGEELGTRTEMKNLNSFQSVERAIAAEFQRQKEALQSGEAIVQQTRRYDQKTGKTYAMRRKENSADYRYFPDPDLPEVYLSDAEMARIRDMIPPLPDARRDTYMREYGLSSYVAEQLTQERWLAEYFEKAAALSSNPVALGNLIIGEVFAQMTLRDKEKTGERDARALPVSAESLAKLSDMGAQGRINSSTVKKILAALFDLDQDPYEYAQAHDLFALSDDKALFDIATQVLLQHQDMVLAYKSGKSGAQKALMGQAMAMAKGKADAEKLHMILMAELEKIVTAP